MSLNEGNTTSQLNPWLHDVPSQVETFESLYMTREDAQRIRDLHIQQELQRIRRTGRLRVARYQSTCVTCDVVGDAIPEYVEPIIFDIHVIQRGGTALGRNVGDLVWYIDQNEVDIIETRTIGREAGTGSVGLHMIGVASTFDELQDLINNTSLDELRGLVPSPTSPHPEVPIETIDRIFQDPVNTQPRTIYQHTYSGNATPTSFSIHEDHPRPTHPAGEPEFPTAYLDGLDMTSFDLSISPTTRYMEVHIQFISPTAYEPNFFYSKIIQIYNNKGCMRLIIVEPHLMDNIMDASGRFNQKWQFQCNIVE